LKVEKNLRKSQAQFWEKLRKLSLRQNDGFLIKKNMLPEYGDLYTFLMKAAELLCFLFPELSKTPTFAHIPSFLTSFEYGSL